MSSPAGNSPSTRIVATCFSFGTRIVYFSRAPGADSVGAILICARVREAHVSATAAATSTDRDGRTYMRFSVLQKLLPEQALSLVWLRPRLSPLLKMVYRYSVFRKPFMRHFCLVSSAGFAILVLAGLVPGASTDGPYRVVKTVKVGGAGTFDTACADT